MLYFNVFASGIEGREQDHLGSFESAAKTRIGTAILHIGVISQIGTSGPEPPIVLYSQDVFDSIRTALRNCV